MYPTLTATRITAANPAVITTAAHGLWAGATYRAIFSGTNCTPSLDGEQEITVTSTTQFTVPVAVTGAGTAGTVNLTAFATLDDLNKTLGSDNDNYGPEWNIGKVSLIDDTTAEFEREIGRALKGRRDEAFVVTKFGKTFSAKMRLVRPFKPLIKPLLALRGSDGGGAVTARRDAVMREDFSAAHLRAAFDASLRRLGMDHVDAILLHGPQVAIYADPELADLLLTLRRQGKARHFGASCDHWDEIPAALALPHVSILQLPYDLIERAGAGELGRIIAQRGIAVMAREVIRLQPAVLPVAAFAAAAAREDVATVVAGTGRLDHLAELASVCA